MKVCLAAVQHNGNIGIVTWKALEAAGHTVIGGYAGGDSPHKALKYMSTMPKMGKDAIIKLILRERPGRS